MQILYEQKTKHPGIVSQTWHVKQTLDDFADSSLQYRHVHTHTYILYICIHIAIYYIHT